MDRAASLLLLSLLHFPVSQGWSGTPSSHAELFELEKALTKSILCGTGGRDDCPEDGGWSSWGPWGGCHGTCGQTGIRHRYRYCSNPPPSNDGEYCAGPNSESKLCRYRGCTLDEYKDFAKCNALRIDQFGILDSVHSEYPSLVKRCVEGECHYDTVEKDEYWNALHCVKHNTGCPEYGGWSSWTTYSDCTAYCGQGKRIRCRTCSNPIPVSEKYRCLGGNCTFSACSGTKCDVMSRGSWNDWNAWSECSSSCGQGMQQRTRTCVDKKSPPLLQPPMPHAHLEVSTCPGDVNRAKRNLDAVLSSDRVCTGPYKELRPCYIKECPVDGDWSEWEPWSQCSKECSLGVQSRSRACSSPPPIHGGETCVGPVTWVRHCFNTPCLGPSSWIKRCAKAPCLGITILPLRCERIKKCLMPTLGYKSGLSDKRGFTFTLLPTQKFNVDQDSAFFRGDGSLNYYKTGISTHLLHIFIKFKSRSKEGELVSREAGPCSNKECATVKLYLNSGRVVLDVNMGGCRIALASFRPIAVGEWVKALVRVTSSGAAMRIGDSDSHYRAKLNCWKTVWPDFDAVMSVGREFRGEISSLVVNYVPRYLKAGNDSHEHQRLTFGDVKMNLAPFSASNVFYSEGEGEEKVLSLDKMIFAPCFKSSASWSIRMVIKTENQDGVVMVIRDFYRAKYLILLFEPYRVVVQLEDGQCFEEVYHLVDHHLGEWFLINIECDGGVVSLDVNGGPKKTIEASRAEAFISCEDNVMIGDVAHMLAKEGNRSRVAKHTSFLRGMKGKLAYLGVDGSEIDLSKLPVESAIQSKQVSSEAASMSKNYFEYRLESGKPLELGCLYFFDESSRKIFAQVNWNYSEPVWLFSTVPIVPGKMMQWGVKYAIEDKKYLSVLSAREYTKESIEGFYSCWLPWNAQSRTSSVLVTYGVTVVVYGEFLYGSHSVAVKTLLLFLLGVLMAALGSLLFEYLRGVFGRSRAEVRDKPSKSLNKELRYVMYHSPELEKNFGVRDKLVDKIRMFDRLLEEKRAKNKKTGNCKRSFVRGSPSERPGSK